MPEILNLTIWSILCANHIGRCLLMNNFMRILSFHFTKFRWSQCPYLQPCDGYYKLLHWSFSSSMLLILYICLYFKYIVAVTWTTPRLGPYQAPCTTPTLGPYQAPIIRRANWSGRALSMLRVVYKM